MPNQQSSGMNQLTKRCMIYNIINCMRHGIQNGKYEIGEENHSQKGKKKLYDR